MFKPSISNTDNIVNIRNVNKILHNSVFLTNNKGNNKLHNKKLSNNSNKNIKFTVLSKNDSFRTDKLLNMTNKNKVNPTLQDMEIMKIFTSPEWSIKQVFKPTINIFKNKEIQINQENKNSVQNKNVTLIKSEVYRQHSETDYQEKYFINGNENLIFPKDSCNSLNSPLYEQDTEKNVENFNENKGKSKDLNNDLAAEVFNCAIKTSESTNMSVDIDMQSKSQITSKLSKNDVVSKDLFSNDDKSFKNDSESSLNIIIHQSQNNIENNNYFHRKYFNEHETSLKHDSEYISQLSNKQLSVSKTFMQHYKLDGLSDSEIIDSSSVWTFNTSTMAQVIHQKKPLIYTTENQTNADSSARLDAAQKIIFENTKKSLGKLLIEGLYQASRRHRNDPFKYLGEWLLIQADIIDENKSD